MMALKSIVVEFNLTSFLKVVVAIKVLVLLMSICEWKNIKAVI